jgi:maleylacetoacetate isomerase
MFELHDFGLSASCYRVRIGLRLKGVEHHVIPVSMVKSGGEQHGAEYRAINPQGLLPTYSDHDLVLTQSLAILEYLDERYPDPPLLPQDPRLRARARQYAQIIACDLQPLTNLRVLAYLRNTLKADATARSLWMRHWLLEALDGLELWLTAERRSGPYCVGDQVTLADICLVPQMFAARRFKLVLDDFPTLCEIEAACLELDAFKQTRPK